MVIAVIILVALLRATGGVLLLPILPLVPLVAIGYVRYQQQRETQRQMSCPKCGLRLSYRRLGPSHGMLECPLLCGYKRLVGDPRRQ